VSDAGLLGGGSGIPRPGEVSLAHHGVLFLDELPEFARNVLELLRQPLEERSVSLARSTMTLNFPASFLLIGAANWSRAGQTTILLGFVCACEEANGVRRDPSDGVCCLLSSYR
jgi:predicted ATPase with chaperone activity